MNFLDTLNKIVRRTERDVALAGAMCGSIAAIEKLFPQMEKWTNLTVHFYGDSIPSQAWIIAPWEVHEWTPWRDFLKWYHGRPQSDNYVMYAQDGHRMFRRADIRSYFIEWGERVKRTDAAKSPQSKEP